MAQPAAAWQCVCGAKTTQQADIAAAQALASTLED